MKNLAHSILLIALISCGGGGGGGNTTPPVTQPPQTQFGTNATFIGPQWTGSFNVATTQYFWEDTTREEPNTTDTTDNREVIVRVFYPTDAAYTDNRLEVISSINWQLISTNESITNSRLRESNYTDAKWDVEIDAAISSSKDCRCIKS